MYDSESESHSVMSESLWPHGLYSPWNSPGQNTGVGRLSLLQGIFPIQGLNPGQSNPADLPDPGIEPESPALQADSLPTELSGMPVMYDMNPLKLTEICFFAQNMVYVLHVPKNNVYSLVV